MDAEESIDLSNNVGQAEEEQDLQPVFIGEEDNTAVEVDVKGDSGAVPEEDMEEGNDDNQQQIGSDSAVEVEDMSSFKVEAVHDDALFAIAATMIDHEPTNQTVLAVASGGGDDRAYVTLVANDGSNHVLKCAYNHRDSVSCTSFNDDHVLAVGSFDGTIQLYDAKNAVYTAASNSELSEIVPTKQLDGPSDIEWLSWHPKGGTVILAGSSDGTVWMWFVPNGKCMQVFVGHGKVK